MMQITDVSETLASKLPNLNQVNISLNKSKPHRNLNEVKVTEGITNAVQHGIRKNNYFPSMSSRGLFSPKRIVSQRTPSYKINSA